MVKRQKNLEGNVISTTKFHLKHVNYKQAVELIKQDMIDQCRFKNLTFVHPSVANTPIISLSRAHSPLHIKTQCPSPALGTPMGDDAQSSIQDADLSKSQTKLSNNTFNKTTDGP